jgi:hypothetical protein
VRRVRRMTGGAIIKVPMFRYPSQNRSALVKTPVPARFAPADKP